MIAVKAAVEGTTAGGLPLYWSVEGRTKAVLFRPFLGGGGLPAADPSAASGGHAGVGLTMRVSKGKNASRERRSDSPAVILLLKGLPGCGVGGIIPTGMLPIFTPTLDAS